MTTKVQLESDLKDAMRSKDEVRKRTLRMTLSAIRLAEIDKGKPLDEQGILSILQKEVKTRQEAITEAQHAGRPELQAEAEDEIGVLEGYLPQPFSDEELDALARQAIAEVGATSEREMGQVMKILVPRLQGRASGSQASQAVRKLLESF
jgi:uncharacterized protein YqeY